MLAGLALFVVVVYVVVVLGGGLLIGETDRANIWLSVLATLIVALGIGATRCLAGHGGDPPRPCRKIISR